MMWRQLTNLQVARRLSIGERRVRQLADEGAIECVETPLGRLFERTEVERVVRERTAQAELDGRVRRPPAG